MFEDTSKIWRLQHKYHGKSSLFIVSKSRAGAGDLGELAGGLCGISAAQPTSSINFYFWICANLAETVQNCLGFGTVTCVSQPEY